MINDSIKNSQRYTALHPDLGRVFDFLASLDAGVTPGTYYVDGRIKVTLSAYVTRQCEDCKFENHRKFIDVQYMVDGEEAIDVTSDELILTEDRLDESDYALYESGSRYLRATLRSREFTVIFPGEKHRPMVAAGDPRRVVKAVAKLEI